jgi:molybdopterin molybdotransferase
MKSLAEIAQTLEGYDPQALPVDKVNEFLAQLVQPVQRMQVLPLQEALGRVLAQDIISPFNVPPHDNSAMDGYAFRGAELSVGTVTRFEVVGSALAGKPWQGTVERGQCVKITTGAVMPAGLDTVAPSELCTVQGDCIDIAPHILRTGDNARKAGEDIAQGSVALQKGEQLRAAALGLLASLNMASVPVFRKLKVAYFSTGDEVLSLGDAAREGAIYDSNRFTVTALLQRWGYDVQDMGLVRDEPAALQAAFESAAQSCDAIITSGGVSVGEADHTKAIMRELGDVTFWRIAMRPGRPMAVGVIDKLGGNEGNDLNDEVSDLSRKNAESRLIHYEVCYENDSKHCILFGLPGNPVATLVTLLAFVRSALLRMSGVRDVPAPLYMKARSLEVMRKKPGRTEYQRGVVSYAADGSLQVRSTGANQGSGVLSSMVQANCLIVLHHAQGGVAVGDGVDVWLLSGLAD